MGIYILYIKLQFINEAAPFIYFKLFILKT